jgi:hypothetical protein
MPNATEQVADPQGWLSRRLKKIEQAIASLQTARRLVAATIGEGGLTVDGGFFRVVDATGAELFYIGPMGPDFTDGTPQRGWTVRRADSTPALAMYDADPGDGSPGTYRQALNWYDRSGNVVLADDTDGGVGLARPYIPWMITSDRDVVTVTNATALNTWVETHVLAGPRQHPKMAVGLSATAPSGTNGELRLVYGSTVVAGPTAFTGAGGGAAPSYLFTLPPGTHMDLTYVSVQARRTAGTGTISVRPFFAYGTQT